MICTVTPNPALDLSGTIQSLKPNEKSYVHDERRAPGGNAINAARILNRLGVPVIASGFLGGSTGEELAFLIKSENLEHHFIPIQGCTRINITVSNQSDHQQTRLSFPGPRVRPSEKRQLFEFVKNKAGLKFLMVGGSLPPGFTTKDIVQLMKIARHRNIETVVDCPGDILSQIIAAGPLLIKPNLEEFHALTKSRVTSKTSVKKRAQVFLSKTPYVCVSSVEGGALLVTRSGTYFGKIPAVKIRSTVGAGDSMVGAMMAQIYKGDSSPEQMLRWGLAAAAATLSEPGTSLGKARKILQLYKKTKVVEV